MTVKNFKPLVSIVIPCYNHEKYVQDAVESVISQTYNNIELLIIDDGSTDNSVSVIESLVETCKKRFVRFEFLSRPNKGLCATLNEAIKWCNGVYFSCIASDDIMLPGKTSLQVEFLNNNKNIVALFGGVEIIDNNNNIVDRIKGTNVTYKFEDIILGNSKLFAPSQMIRTQSIKDVGGYKPDLLIEDYYMWLKLAEIGDLYCLEQYLSQYRQHENNTSKNIEKMHQGRLQLLSYFNNSVFYDQAIKDEYWLYHLQQLTHSKNNILYNLFYVMRTKPIKTTKLVINKILKKF